MIQKIKPELVALKDKLFKETAYDIRAYVGEVGNFFSNGAVLTPESMELVGILMGSMVFQLQDGTSVSLNEGDVVIVGYDNGPTSKALADAISLGLISQGIIVYDVGLASSGQVYRNQGQLDAKGDVVVTRSHVEVTTNGAKFSVRGQGIHTYLLGQMNKVVSTSFAGKEGTKEAIVKDKTNEGFKLYRDKLISRYKPYFERSPREVAVNLFGGTGLKYNDLFKEILGSKTLILGNSINVNDGGLLADPTRKEMLEKVPGFKEALQKGLRVHSFDLDADRGAITEGADALDIGKTGHYLGDDLSFIAAEYKLTIAVPKLFMELSKAGISREHLNEIHKIATTVYVDPRYTSAVASYVKSKGGTTVYHRKGHSLWKETMLSNMNRLAHLAGCKSIADFMDLSGGYQDIQVEASLHLFATDPEDGIPRDDAVENVFILEKIIDKLNISSFKSFFSHIPRRFATKEIRTTSVSNETKEKITYAVIDEIKKTFTGEKYNLVEFDGQIRVDWSSGFLMYGMSNTSPKLTFMAEGTTIAERNQALCYLLALHNKFKKDFNDPTPMDLSENSFFIKDASFDIKYPDELVEGDLRVQAFKTKMGI